MHRSRVGTLRGYQVIEEGLIEPTFPIDVVYTWVDSSAPEFQAVLAEHLPKTEAISDTMGSQRFRSHDELRYSLRSIEYFAPWVNHIFIVTNGQRPSWLAQHAKVSIVRHDDIIEPRYLPTFNSHVIESALHRIPRLAEHYLYFNDDVLLLRPLRPIDAFTGSGLAYGFVNNIGVPSGRPLPHETATIWGIKNGRDLVHREWGQVFSRRFQHMFFPHVKVVAELCERTFAKEYDEFRRNKFRSMNDVLCTGFLHPVVGYMTRQAILVFARPWYIKIAHPSAINVYKTILREQGNGLGRMAACVNDTTYADNNLEDYDHCLRTFLETYFPVPSSFELCPKAGQ